MQLVRVLAMVVVGSTSASAQPVIVEPASGQLAFGDVAIGVPSTAQRIRLVNDPDPFIRISEVSTDFVIVAEGGSTAPGEERFWDIACLATDTSQQSGSFEVIWCGLDCELEGRLTVELSCSGGLLAPSVTNVVMPAVFAEQRATSTFTVTNAQLGPLTITELVGPAQFTAVPAVGALPLTLGPGESADLVVDFDAAGGSHQGLLDLKSGTTILDRVRVQGFTLDQVQPDAWSFEAVPLGATYARTITIRNSSLAGRTLTGAAFDHPDFTVAAPSGAFASTEVRKGQVTFTASTLGDVTGTLSIGFDSAQGDVAAFRATVVPATFAVETGDATPDDGAVELGVVPRDTVVEGTFTIVNHLATERTVVGCFMAPAVELLAPCPATLPPNAGVTRTFRLAALPPGVHVDGISIGVAGVGAILVAYDLEVLAQPFAGSSTELAFAETELGDTSTQVITITNRTDVEVTQPIAVAGAGFALAGPALTLAARASADVTVTFSPTAAGIASGTIEIGADPDRLVVALTGTAVEPPPDDDDDDDVPPEDGGCSTGTSGSLLVGLLALALRRRRGA